MTGGVYTPYTVEPLFDHADSSRLANPISRGSIAARLRPGYSRADAQAELTTILRQQDRAYLETRSPA